MTGLSSSPSGPTESADNGNTVDDMAAVKEILSRAMGTVVYMKRSVTANDVRAVLREFSTRVTLQSLLRGTRTYKQSPDVKTLNQPMLLNYMYYHAGNVLGSGVHAIRSGIHRLLGKDSLPLRKPLQYPVPKLGALEYQLDTLIQILEEMLRQEPHR